MPFQQKSNCEEALELLKTSLDSCRQLPLSLVMFYDELAELMDCKALHPTIIEWSADYNSLRPVSQKLLTVMLFLGLKRNIYLYCRIGRHVGEFESLFLSDIDGGQLPKESYCGLEGEYCDETCLSAF